MKQTDALSFIITLLLFSGCAMMQPPPVPAKQTFSFDYKLPSTQKLGSAGTVLALVKPNYGNAFIYTNNELFRRLKSSMEDDVEEMIIDKGFTIKSEEPFESLDDMIFDDKKNTDIVIKIEMNPEFTAQNGNWRTNVDLLFRDMTTYSYTGTVSLIGKINLVGIEPLSGQKIWSKSVTIPEIRDIAIRTEVKHQSIDIDLFSDPGVYNAVGAAFSAQYKGVMDKIAAHFNPEEFRSMKSQIKELKSKKGY